MRFYYNSELNICAEEPWVVDYLYYDGTVNSREEALKELRTKREFYGWFDCEVSNTIAERFMYQRKINNLPLFIRRMTSKYSQKKFLISLLVFGIINNRKGLFSNEN